MNATGPTTGLLGALAALQACEATTSVSAKVAALRTHRDNAWLRQVLEYTLDPRRNYFIRDPQVVQPDDAAPQPLGAEQADAVWDAFREVLDRLARRALTGHAAQNEVRAVLARCDGPGRKWLVRVLTRDLRVGLQTTMVRRVWHDFLTVTVTAGHTPYLGCMLALDAKHVLGGLARVLEMAGSDGVEASFKLDGFRFVGPCEGGTCALYSRGGQRRPYLDQIEAELAEVFDGFVVDGEVYTDLDTGNWNEVASLVGRTKSPITSEQKERLRYYIFDLIPLAQYRTPPAQQAAAGGWDYGTRAGNLDALFTKAKAAGCLPHVELVPYSICTTEAEIDMFYAEALQHGFEGLVIKPLSYLPYVTTGDRPEAGWLKAKPTDDATVTVLRVLPGTGRNADRMGAVEVRDASGNVWKVGVFLTRRAGESDRLRELFWRHRDNLVGLQVDVRSQRTKTREGLVKVSFPRITRIRADLGWDGLGAPDDTHGEQPRGDAAVGVSGAATEDGERVA